MNGGMVRTRQNLVNEKAREVGFSGFFSTALFAKLANYLRAFMKDVRTLAQNGELSQTLAAIRELSQLVNVTARKIAA